MNETAQKNDNFINIYSKSHRLAAAVFIISNVIDQSEELKTRIKNLSLELVSTSVRLKDINYLDAKKLVTDLEKNSLELISMLDIASVSGLISKMNGSVIKEEFQSFILELGKFNERFENNINIPVKDIFVESSILSINTGPQKINTSDFIVSDMSKNEQRNEIGKGYKNGNGHKRKDLRKNTILDFIKGHNMVSIKDIATNITGCSEKTIQRELISLINEAKIKKIGERRWSRYSIM